MELLKSKPILAGILVLILAVVTFFFWRDLKREVHEWTADTVMENNSLPAVDYCKTRSRLSCILQRTPQTVLDFCAKNFQEGTQCKAK